MITDVQVQEVALKAIRIQSEMRRGNGMKRPSGFELMGWLRDAVKQFSSVFGMECQVGNDQLIYNYYNQTTKHIPVFKITEYIFKPVSAFINPNILCLVIIDSDDKRYLLQATDISFHWYDFVKAINSYKKHKDI